MSILEAENQFNRRDGPQIVIPKLNGNITKVYKQDPSRHYSRKTGSLEPGGGGGGTGGAAPPTFFTTHVFFIMNDSKKKLKKC